MAAIGHKAVFQTSVQTQGSGFGNKLTLPVSGDIIANAKYLVLCYAQLGGASNNSNVQARLLHGTTLFPNALHIMEPAGQATDSPPEMHSYAYMTVWDVGGTPEALNLEIQGTASAPASADSIVIFIMRLDADLVRGVDWEYQEDLSASFHSTFFQQNAFVELPVASGDEVLVIANFCYQVFNLTANVQANIRESVGVTTNQTVPAFSQEGEVSLSENLSQLLSRAYTGLSEDTHRWTVQSRDDSSPGRGAQPTVYRSSRVFALRLSAFNQTASQWTEAEISASSEATVATAAVTPSVDGEYLLLGYSAFDAGGAGRFAHLFVDEQGGAATPAGADLNFAAGAYDGTDDCPMTALAVPTLTVAGGAKTFNLRALAALGVIQHRSLLLLSMELASTGGSPPLFPAPIPLTLTVPAPTLTFGALTVAASPGALLIAVVEPSVDLGTKTLSPAAIPLAVTSVQPTLTLGAKTLSPAPVPVPLTVVQPFVDVGGVPIVLSPDPVALAVTSVQPTLTLGAKTLSPAPVPVPLTVPAPTLTLVKTLSPAAIPLALTVVDPSIILGTKTISPAPVPLALTVPVPDVVLGAVTTLLVGDIWRTDPAADYPTTATFELEVELSVDSVADIATATLFNVTDGTVVPATSISTGNTTKTLLRTPVITFPAAGTVKDYRVLLTGTPGSARWHSSKLRVKNT